MAKKLKICHIITRMIIGGAQENTLLTVRGLMERGHDVVLLTGPTHGPEGRLLDTVDIPGLKVELLPSLVRALSPLDDWRALRWLTSYIREQQFDVVHTHSSKAGILGRLAASRAGCPLIVHTVHGQAFHPYERWWRNVIYRQAERLAARHCHHIITVAAAMIDQCVAARVAPRDKYSVIYSGMTLEAFRQAVPDAGLRERLGIPEDAPVIGKIARLFDLKGHEYLIAAASDIVAAFPKVRFLLVGDGTLRRHLERDIARRGLTDNFVFAGLVPPEEVCRYTALMDILVHLSLREGLPRTVVQALAAGKPAVGFALDGTPEVITHNETGLLCPPGDVAAVRDALLRLLRNPQAARLMGQAGQKFVARHFDWRVMVDQIEALYLRLGVCRTSNGFSLR